MTLSAPEYLASQPAQKVTVFAATKEHLDKSKEIAEMYEAALGQGGVGGTGCEAYPDPDLFTEAGIKSTIEAGERLIALAQYEGQIVGAMVCDSLSPYHVEFNSMAVRRDKRGLKIGSAIVNGLSDLMEANQLTINTTELVTHSLASQAAHFQAGYRSIAGFAFCHYPRVFFANHPESVLWVTKFQGKLITVARTIRSALGRKLGTTASDVVQNLLTAQAQGRVASTRLAEEQLQLLAELLMARVAYVPQAYADIVQAILFQFEEILDRKVESYLRPDAEESNSESLNSENPENSDESIEAIIIEFKEGFGHSYIVYKPGFQFDREAIDEALQAVHEQKKRYILVRIPANQPEAIALADYLRQEKGFVFHSYLPLYGSGAEDLYDVLTLQWIAPEVLAENELPGQTESVVKLYGYPENLSGPIVRLIASELRGKEKC